jgi:uncharacterized protein YprB with RNaseH-like and TPR domain
MERKIWTSNIRSWDDFLTNSLDFKNDELMKKYLALSKDRYEKKDHEFFSSKLLSRYHWRAYDDFRDNACFLDIETTGLSKQHDDITTIGVFDGKESKVFINGRNMHEFPEEIMKYSYIVTFNGATFDMPFIRSKFPGLKMNHFHADLRFMLRALGYSGGLKNIEKQMGINREGDLADLSGRDAVKLWFKYKRDNDEKALDTLVRYNIEDIENLKTLMEFCYGKMKEGCIGCTNKETASQPLG